MKAILISLATAALAVAWAPSAAAQQARAETTEAYGGGVQAPRRALELTVGSGYTQGFGMLQSGVAMVDVVRPGIALDVGAAYRLDPYWSFGATAQYQEIYAQRANSARGFTGGLAATYHIAPFTRIDPFVQLGTGYRALWESFSSQPDLVTHGFQLARLTAGLDLRTSTDIAIAPLIGADLTAFFWQDGSSSAVAIKEPRASTFVYAGIQGRFDLAAAHVSQATYTARR